MARDACFKVIGGSLAASAAIRARWLIGRLIGRLLGRAWPPQPQIITERNAMMPLSLLALLGRIFDPLAALLDEAATSASAREAAR